MQTYESPMATRLQSHPPGPGQLQNEANWVDHFLQLPLALVVLVNAPDHCKDLSYNEQPFKYLCQKTTTKKKLCHIWVPQTGLCGYLLRGSRSLRKSKSVFTFWWQSEGKKANKFLVFWWLPYSWGVSYKWFQGGCTCVCGILGAQGCPEVTVFNFYLFNLGSLVRECLLANPWWFFSPVNVSERYVFRLHS